VLLFALLLLVLLCESHHAFSLQRILSRIPQQQQGSSRLAAASQQGDETDDVFVEKKSDNSKKEDDVSVNPSEYLFAKANGEKQTTNSASFGDVVQRRTNPGADSTANFGDSVQISKPSERLSSAEFGDVVSMKKKKKPDLITDLLTTPTEAPECVVEEKAVAEKIRQRNLVAAALSIVLAVSNFGWQYTHPETPIQILAELQQQSAPVTIIGSNDRPTLVDFW